MSLRVAVQRILRLVCWCDTGIGVSSMETTVRTVNHRQVVLRSEVCHWRICVRDLKVQNKKLALAIYGSMDQSDKYLSEWVVCLACKNITGWLPAPLQEHAWEYTLANYFRHFLLVYISIVYVLLFAGHFWFLLKSCEFFNPTFSPKIL